MSLDFGVVLENLDIMLFAARLSLYVAVVGFAIAIMIGLVVALARRSRLAPVRWLAFTYTNFFRGASLYVLIIWLYFGIAVAFNIRLGAMTAGVMTLALLNGAYLSEVFRSGIEAVDVGQREAALAMGLSDTEVVRDVVAPQALRIALPATGNHFIDAVKDSAILSVIGVPELMRETQRLVSNTFRPFEFYVTAAVLYLIAVYAVALLLRWAERRLRLEEAAAGPVAAPALEQASEAPTH